MNKLITVGRLTADPVTRDVNGSTVCSFTVASDTRRKDESGNYIANFYRVDAWRMLGENCAKYLHKGDRVSLMGSLFLRTYTDTHGQTRYSMDVTADEVGFMSDRRQDSQPTNDKPAQARTAPAQVQNTAADDDEDLPF